MAQPTPAAPTDLTGLWQAKRRFGPDEGGTLVIERSGQSWVADLSGRRFAVATRGDELSFELPGSRGEFRGRVQGSSIRGLWIRAGTPVNGRFASPVHLQRAGRDRWIAEVDPLNDSFTLYLLLQPRSDGSFGAVLRNPDRDIGTQLGANRLIREGEVIRLIGQRGDGPERELARGRLDVENDTFTLHLPNRGGTFDFVREGDHSLFYPRGRSPSPYVYRAPPARDDGWRTGTLEEVGIDRLAMERLVRSILAASMETTDAPQIHALLVARRGRLVLEEYFHGVGRETLHDTRSAAKSVTSVAIGAAMRAGAPLRLSSPVYKVMNGGTFPSGLDDARKRAMTLEHLLTMSSGHYCDDTDEAAPGNENRMQEQTDEPDWHLYTLRVPLATSPGENSVYCSASPHLALGMVGRATGEMPVFAFDRLVASPMQIGNYAFPLDPAGNPYGGGGVRLTGRDFLKFGQLMLNDGVWNGQRILDADYVAAAISPQYHLRNIYYGYLWWIEEYPYRDRMVRGVSARGAGGNLVTVIPELDLAVATLAGNYFSRTQGTYTGGLVPRSILPAVRERGDDPQALVTDRDFTSPYGRSTNGSRVTSARQGEGRPRR